MDDIKIQDFKAKLAKAKSLLPKHRYETLEQMGARHRRQRPTLRKKLLLAKSHKEERLNKIRSVDGLPRKNEIIVPSSDTVNKNIKFSQIFATPLWDVKRKWKKGEPITAPRGVFTRVKKALKGYALSYTIYLIDQMYLDVQLYQTRAPLAKLFLNAITKTNMKNLKFVEAIDTTVAVKRIEIDEIGNQIDFEELQQAFIFSKVYHVMNGNDIFPNLENSMDDISKKFQFHFQWKSNLYIKAINAHYVHLNHANPVAGASYIELPKELQHHKKGIINIKNDDNECFRRCHVRLLNPIPEMPIK